MQKKKKYNSTSLLFHKMLDIDKDHGNKLVSHER